MGLTQHLSHGINLSVHVDVFRYENLHGHNLITIIGLHEASFSE